MSKIGKKAASPAAKRKKARLLPYLLIAPAMILFFLFTYYPFLKTIVLSFAVTDKKGNFAKWVGLSNWIRVLSKDTFWNTVVITLKMAAVNLIFTFTIAMIFALLAKPMKKYFLAEDIR